jgi:hypothetical protein
LEKQFLILPLVSSEMRDFLQALQLISYDDLPRELFFFFFFNLEWDTSLPVFLLASRIRRKIDPSEWAIFIGKFMEIRSQPDGDSMDDAI